jgi:hypothetical protein
MFQNLNHKSIFEEQFKLNYNYFIGDKKEGRTKNYILKITTFTMMPSLATLNQDYKSDIFTKHIKILI